MLHRIKEIYIGGKLHEWIKHGKTIESKVAINGVTSERMPVTNGVPSGSVLGPVLFIYININLGLKNVISKFANDPKIGNAVLSECDRRSLQEDLRKISYWSVKWETPVNIYKSWILHVGSRNMKNDRNV